MDGWVWSNGGMILTGENWSTGRKTLYSVGGRWMNVCGTMVKWYWQGKTKEIWSLSFPITRPEDCTVAHTTEPVSNSSVHPQCYGAEPHVPGHVRIFLKYRKSGCNFHSLLRLLTVTLNTIWHSPQQNVWNETEIVVEGSKWYAPKWRVWGREDRQSAVRISGKWDWRGFVCQCELGREIGE